MTGFCGTTPCRAEAAAFCALLTFVAVALSACADDGGSNAAPASSVTPTRTPTPEVTRIERTVVDATRETPANGTFAGAPSRTLRVLIWVASGKGSPARPLLIMAHGFGGLPEKLDAFARFVAMQGFVIAAPAFPLTNQDAPGGHDT